MNSKRLQGLQAAIGNNMDWYCAEGESWGIPYQREHEYWVCTQKMPPFHSNLVCAHADPKPYIDRIRQAASEQQIKSDWTIKDAYHQFDLKPLGFDVLFDAHWYVLAAGEIHADIAFDDLSHMHRVSDAHTLKAWVSAWGETPLGTTIFVPALLKNPNVALYYLKRGEEIVAGLCTNQSETCVGITNVFGKPEDLNICYAHVAQTNPNLALVGYDREDELVHLSRLGAQCVGDLRIWQNKES